MGHCKDSKKCENKYVIRCLPCTISKPGHYCLGKDFLWNSTLQSAITVNSDNVVLDFNQRKITANSESTIPVLLVEGVKDVVLNDVHLEGANGGKLASSGLKIASSSSVKVNSPVFYNMGNGSYENASLVAENVNGLEVFKLYLKNDGESLPFDSFAGISINSSYNVTVVDSKITNGIVVFENVVNATILKSEIDNFNVPAGFEQRGIIISSDSDKQGEVTNNVRISDCSIRVRDWYGIFLASFPFDTETPLYNVMVDNNTIVKGDGGAETYSGYGIYLQGANNCDIRNNLVTVEGDSVAFALGTGIYLYGSQNSSVTNNTVSVNSGSPYGILLFGDDSTPIFTTSRNTISGNKIARDNSISSAVTLGICLDSFPDYDYCKFNTISNNTVTGFDDGVSDRDSNFVGFATASCNVFADNIANANVNNFLIDTSSPPDNFDYNNRSGCSVPAPVSLVKKQSDNKERVIVRENKKQRRNL